jgi:hypothetical protein
MFMRGVGELLSYMLELLKLRRRGDIGNALIHL